MDYEDFRRRLLDLVPAGLVPAAVAPGERFAAFGFVSAVFVPAYTAALGDASPDRLRELSDLLELGLSGEDGVLVDALAMRVVERLLCRDHRHLAVARPYLGSFTLEVASRIGALIEQADRAAAGAASSPPGSASPQSC